MRQPACNRWFGRMGTGECFEQRISILHLNKDYVDVQKISAIHQALFVVANPDEPLLYYELFQKTIWWRQ